MSFWTEEKGAGRGLGFRRESGHFAGRKDGAEARGRQIPAQLPRNDGTKERTQQSRFVRGSFWPYSIHTRLE